MPSGTRPLRASTEPSAKAVPSTKPVPTTKRGRAPQNLTAEEMAGQQREISVSEFFTKNRHLLGFDNPRKALLTTVKEAVDNALDACEEAGILPFVEVSIERVAARGRAAADAPPAEGAALPLFEGKPPEPAKPVADEDDDDAGPRKRGVAAPPERFVVSVEDNGPGIVKEQVAKIFGKLLYGSKFHRLRQSLTADQPVLVERRGRVERLPIGELVDGFLREGEDLADVSECGLRAPAFDRASGRYAWSPVSHVIRHPRAQEVLEIRTECGRSVRVTGCHSLFTFDSDVVRVREVEARRLRPGDFVVAPRRLPAPRARHRVNLLDELRAEDLRVRWIYVYGVPRPLLRRLRRGAEIVHRVGADGRSRRHFRVRTRGHDALEVLDESWSQYEAKGFLPAWIAKDLGLESECSGARLRTYYHGRPVETPVTWRLTPSLMRMLGLFVAEGHSDRRQIAFTFGSHERAYVDEVVASARRLGLSSSVEERDRHAIRVKLFGGAVDLLFPAWCGRGAKGKRVPWFVFGARTALRQHFLDALCQGDGHRVRGRDVLMFGSASEVLRDDVDTLWLLQGVVASRSRPVRQRGLGRDPSTSWRVDVHGADLDRSHVFRSERAGARGNRYRSLPFALTGSDALLPSGRVAPTTERLLVAAGLGRGPGGVRKSKAIFEGLRRGREYTTTDLARLCGERVTRHLPEHMVSLGLMKRSGAAYRGAPGLDRLRGRVRAAIEFGRSDLCLLQITEVRRVEDANPFVYDLCVPGRENFVAGNGALACHNSRGQQGIGISAAGMYGQLTTGKAVRIWSRTSKKKPAHFIEMHMDLRKNAPEVTKDETVEWEREHATGTKVAIELEAKYQKGAKSVDDYLRQTALANPHVTIRYRDPDGGDTLIERAVKTLPEPSREIQPHPYGVELGMLIQMMKATSSKKLKAFLQNEFSRVSSGTASKICAEAGLPPTAWVTRIAREEADRLHRALSEVKIQNPPTDCVSPIGEEAVRKALLRERPGAFVHAVTRSPSVYRGNPFVVEAGVAWGGENAPPVEELATLFRFANRVPLLYQQGACAVNKAVLSCPWRNYGVDQSRGALPAGPLLVFVHLASVWVPFTSESKEAIAHYPEILKEIRLAVMDCGRNLGLHLSRQRRMADAQKKKDYIAAYLPHIVAALTEILDLDEKAQKSATKNLTEILEKSREI